MKTKSLGRRGVASLIAPVLVTEGTRTNRHARRAASKGSVRDKRFINNLDGRVIEIIDTDDTWAHFEVTNSRDGNPLDTRPPKSGKIALLTLKASRSWRQL